MITSRAIPGQLPEALRRLSASPTAFRVLKSTWRERVMSRPTICNRLQPYGWNVLVYSILVRKSVLNP
jgi:hypothetical protein